MEETENEVWVDIDDAELTALALGAAPEPELPADAVPLQLPIGAGAGAAGGLGAWYMAPVTTLRCSGWRRPVVVGIVATLVVLEALGLCSAFGQVVVG